MKSPWSAGVFTVLGILIVKASSDDDYQETPGPIITYDNYTTSGSEIILQRGQNFTLKCKGQTPVQFKQQSIVEEPYGATFTMAHRNVSSDLDTFEIALDLSDVDQYTVGYYACFDNTINSSQILNEITEEPVNTEHVTYVYIFVNGTDKLLAPMPELITTRSKGPVIIGCKPTMPDIQITLRAENGEFAHVLDEHKYNDKIGYTIDNEVFPDGVSMIFCDLLNPDSKTNPKQVFIEKCTRLKVPIPDIKAVKSSRYFLAGETFSLNCTVLYQSNNAVDLLWDYPRNIEKGSVIMTSNAYEVADESESLFKVLTIRNATADAAGFYTCYASNSGDKRKKSFKMEYLASPFLELWKMNGTTEYSTKSARILTSVKAYPEPTFYFLRDYEFNLVNSSKISLTKHRSGDILFEIRNLDIKDTGNYTLVVSNSAGTKNVTYDVRVKAAPVVDFELKKDVMHLLNQSISLLCEATGYPLPDITWNYTASYKDILFPTTKLNEYTVQSRLTILARLSENITCIAKNSVSSDNATRQLLIYELQDGFGITDSPVWTPVDHDVSLKCLASKYDFQNLTWHGYENLAARVQYSETPFSHVAVLKINKIPLDGSRNYTCVGSRIEDQDGVGRDVSETIGLEVEENRDIIFDEPKTDVELQVSVYQPVQFYCQVDAVPRPDIQWYKDGIVLFNETDGIIILDDKINEAGINSTIIIAQMKEENKGKYECVANNDNSREERKSISLILKEKSPYTATYISIISVIFLALLILVIYLTCKVRREKRLRKELAAAGLLYFKEGVTKSLNPDLVVDDQAELLPYDDKFEFPPEKLFLGRQLGAGAFGVVYKADARGIINAEETTTVAVKMVKKTADNMYIKALASELKIMVHLGKHVNIVNLLGACTKNVGKRELIVIVEYCRFGNIHNYMQKHREVFIDQLTDNKEKNQGRVNRGYSCSSTSSGMHSDYTGSNHTQATDHTCLNTTNTTRSGRKDKPNQQVEFIKVSDSYVQPEWRSNYESDYQSLAPRPLFSRDLLAWAFQIARGMEYLASRKVLHGDLAARNVLLADDNVVKICDFGLARSIYKNDEYQKKENSPLPVKWLAIECMMDRIFSTQSDVWSFGIVLWELFSLAKTPYPNMSPQSLLKYLTDGHRLEKPSYADDRLYDVMKRCWELKPTLRPSFSQLQEILGSFLEDNVRNHYVDLNSSCMDMNAKNEGQEDYLAMMSAPDYNNLVTPSPHHYVNEVRSFFPPSPNQIPHDEEGYLQMTPGNKAVFSPMSTNTKFDFDPRKMNTRLSEASHCGSELTPMLTLNNLPAKSGSELDHEGGNSPYLKMCPRIEEESDEVFQTKANNEKNTQNSAVTNPTYITFDVDGEKKSHNMKNTYINMPNGLVK